MKTLLNGANRILGDFVDIVTIRNCPRTGPGRGAETCGWDRSGLLRSDWRSPWASQWLHLAMRSRRAPRATPTTPWDGWCRPPTRPAGAKTGSSPTQVVSSNPNLPPVAVNDTMAGRAGYAVTFDPRANDTDPNGDSLAVQSVTQPAHGSLTVGTNGTSVIYTASANTPDSFTYTISDGRGGASTATVAVVPWTQVNYLIAAGGGGGGDSYSTGGSSGGGGAGGLLTGSASLTSGMALTVTVGTGGAGASFGSNTKGASGNNSSITGIGTAVGGGGGAGNGSAPGLNGGSGGGGDSSVIPYGGSGTAGQGNSGGAGLSSQGAGGGGGGGGAGGAGVASTGVNGGNGGPGIVSSISGAAATYCAGGGGGSKMGSGTPGNTPNSAYCGGGGGSLGGGSGQSGVVIIGYVGGLRGTGGAITSATINGVTYTVHTFTANGTFTLN